MQKVISFAVFNSNLMLSNVKFDVFTTNVFSFFLRYFWQMFKTRHLLKIIFQFEALKTSIPGRNSNFENLSRPQYFLL